MHLILINHSNLINKIQESQGQLYEVEIANVNFFPFQVIMCHYMKKQEISIYFNNIRLWGWVLYEQNSQWGAAKLIACAADETKPWLSLSANQRRNPCSGPPAVYQDLSTHHVTNQG